MKRRGFLKLIGLGAAGAAVTPLVGANAQETVERDADVNWNPAYPNPPSVKLDGPTLISGVHVPRLITGGHVTVSHGDPSEFDVAGGVVDFPGVSPYIPFDPVLGLSFPWHKQYSCVGITDQGEVEVQSFDHPDWYTPADQRRLVHIATVFHFDHSTVTSIQMAQRVTAEGHLAIVDALESETWNSR